MAGTGRDPTRPYPLVNQSIDIIYVYSALFRALISLLGAIVVAMAKRLKRAAPEQRFVPAMGNDMVKDFCSRDRFIVVQAHDT